MVWFAGAGEAALCEGWPRSSSGGAEVMLRTYFVQQQFSLPDLRVEKVLYKSPVLQRFFGVGLGAAPAMHEATIGRFRPLLKSNMRKLGCDDSPRSFFNQNASGKRDPEIHRTKKCNQWYFGLKTPIGVDANEGAVHSVATTAATVADSRVLPDLGYQVVMATVA